jgi:transcriptional regulator with XRE-family HTH domain
MDMKKIVSELLSTGLTQQQLADLVNCKQPTINAFLHGKRGKRPTLEIGSGLLDLYSERVEKRKPSRRTKKQKQEPI